ncbi:GTP-binding protein HflX [Rhodothalassium salexigens DSM 2132]|uniref:GTPase HflX n=1 Tax=Rhodothalassium salexigens DSM 2132 TaxID=1188247 RepID=A0A4R2PRF7_RHOSA|nr:GTPase HflX [Rhodothalassium salexigens]MBB4210153.1 GTP-binding protein HflX [Rhodothalassium salexigens DSM 2132]MBK1639320.1 GTPase HflX [Rhodothalassium salexigens DSM 2132]TCP38317.1 GTP-binding protein HflX [Rhodothalassium salexigens DSM 2132]
MALKSFLPDSDAPVADVTTGARALIVHPYLKHDTGAPGGAGLRSPDARLAEAVGLAAAIALDVADTRLVALDRVRPGTFLGSGKVDELAALVAAAEIELVVMDTALSPVQQRNLERALKAKVIDRTGLILEIFGERARTREGEMQVELAHLGYQRSRLVRSWTHLERQRGGLGFIGGPGESQIEEDRRLIDGRIAKLRRQLAGVTRTRLLHRAQRRKAPYPVIALVGYTNAGKSTLFNHMIEGNGVFAADLLFATLDPTMRGLDLRPGRRVVLSDTVGFISDLPTDLIAAFRATLEEVTAADLILHVRDVAHPETEAQRADVLAVLRDLGVDPGEEQGPPILEVANKIDLLDADEATRWQATAERGDTGTDAGTPGVAAVSAATGAGLDALADRIDAILGAADTVVEVTLEPGDGETRAWLHRHGDVLDQRSDDDGRQHLTVRIDPADRGRLEKRLSGARVES